MLESLFMRGRITQPRRASAAAARTVTGSPSGNLAPAMAGDSLPSPGLLPLRDPPGTHRRRLRTAGAIDAAARRRERRWRLTDAHPCQSGRLDLRIGDRNRRQELAAVRMTRGGEQRRGGCELHHAPEIEHEHPLAKPPHEREIVADEQKR